MGLVLYDYMVQCLILTRSLIYRYILFSFLRGMPVISISFLIFLRSHKSPVCFFKVSRIPRDREVAWRKYGEYGGTQIRRNTAINLLQKLPLPRDFIKSILNSFPYHGISTSLAEWLAKSQICLSSFDSKLRSIASIQFSACLKADRQTNISYRGP